MSKVIDEKVVEMEFDNSRFEKNVKTSMSTIDDLKESLKFSDSTRGLENINKAAKDVNVSGIGTAVETVQAKFSAMEVIAITALANITNSAVEAGKKLVKSLSVDNIAEGWDKFSNKTQSVGTLIAQGFDLDTVNEQLDRLNWFTDETSYNFTDMVANIAKFTASGKDLNESVTAMEGIANWAALSGQNAQTASHAMYQLSQAMGAGVMRKEDYKSIQNVSMDTDEFRQKALDAAVALGTLQKNVDGTYTSLVSANGSFTKAQFAEHLTKDAWFTSDVMMKVFTDYSSAVDQIYEYADEHGLTASEAIEELGDSVNEFGLKAFKAAQEARTFGDVIDSVKDAVGTGWMKTFELIFGNYEEAKTLWTDLANELYDVFASGAESRNELLNDWHDNGGREAFINGLWNSFHALVDVMSTVKEAFREIFPPMTAERLVEISKNFEKLTEKFKMSDETSDKLKRTFKGLFAALDIVKQALSAIWYGIKLLLPFTGKLKDHVLDLTAKFGDFIVKIDDYIKKNETFKKAIEALVEFIKSIPSKINGAFEAITGKGLSDVFDKIKEKAEGALEKIKEVFSNFRSVDTSGMDSLSEKVKTKLEPLSALFDGIKKVLGGLWEFLKKLAPIFSAIATAIGNALGKLGDAIKTSVGDADFSDVLDLVNSGILVAIGVGIKKLVDTLKSATENASGILESFKGIFDGVRGCLEAWQQNLKANVLLKIAAALAILTASVFVLSKIDAENMSVALSAMTAEFIELMTAMAVFDKMSGGSGMKGLSKAATAMIKMAAAVLILSIALKKVSDIEADKLTSAMFAVTGLITDLVSASIVLSKYGDKVKTSSLGMILFAEAINVLARAVKKFGELDYDVLKKGLISVGIVMAELVAFMVGAKFGSFKASQGLAIIELAAALLILQKAVSAFGGMDTGILIQGLAGTAAVFAELVGFIKLTGDAKKVISTAIGMQILGAAMLIFSKAIASIGSMSLETLGKGLLGMGVALAMVAVAMNNMPATTPLIAAGMVLLGAAMKIIASAMKSFGEMSWEEICKSMVMLAGTLIAVAAALNLMKGTLGASAAMLIFADALLLLLIPLKVFSKMSMEEIGKSLLMLAGTFAVIGVAGLLLKPLVPTLLAFGAAITLVGVGVLACGVGLLALSAALTTLSVAGGAAITVITMAIKAIIDLIPYFLEKVGEGLISFITMIGEAAPDIGIAITEIVNSTVEMLRNTLPNIIDLVIELIDKLLSAIAKKTPSILKSAMDIVIGVLQAFRDNIGEIVTIVIDALVNLMEAIAEKIPELVQAGIDIVIALIDGLAQGLVDNAERLREAFLNLLASLLEAILIFFGIHSPSTVFADIGVNLIEGLIEGIWSMLKALLSKIGEIMLEILSAVVGFLGDFFAKGAEIVGNIASGIWSAVKTVVSKIQEVVQNVIEAVVEFFTKFFEKGKEIVTNIASGIWDAVTTVVSKIGEVIGKVVSKIGEFFSSFFDKGKEIVGKIASGIWDALTTITTKIGEVIKKVISKIGESFTDFFDKGKEIIGKIASGIWDAVTTVTSKVGEVIQECVDKIGDFLGDFVDAGLNLMAGFAEGIWDGLSTAEKAIEDVGGDVIMSICEFFGIESPSKVFRQLGVYTMEGFAIGIESCADRVRESSIDVGENALDGIAGAIANYPTDLDILMDVEPKITPIVDLSEVTKSANSINDMLTANRSFELASTSNVGINASLDNNQKKLDEITANNKDIVDAITNLRSDVNALASALNGLGIVLDTGTLVGALAEPINEALGKQAVFDGRRI